MPDEGNGNGSPYRLPYQIPPMQAWQISTYVLHQVCHERTLFQSVHSCTLDERLLPMHFPSQACSTMSPCEILKQSEPEPSMGTQVVRCWYPAFFTSRWLRNLLHSSCQITRTYIAFRPAATFRKPFGRNYKLRYPDVLADFGRALFRHNLSNPPRTWPNSPQPIGFTQKRGGDCFAAFLNCPRLLRTVDNLL